MARKKAATKTRTKKAKPTKRAKPTMKAGKARRRIPVASREVANGEAAKPKRAGQSAKFAANQPPIEGLEDTDERIPALDELCASYLADGATMKAAKTRQNTTAGEIQELIGDKKLELYIYQGQKFYIEPGSDHLKCVVVKQGQ